MSFAKLRLLLCLMLCGVMADTYGSEPKVSLYRFADAPGWIAAAQPQYDADDAPGDVSDGTWYLLLDRQINLYEHGDDDYRHVALKVVNAAGIEAQSQFAFTVDPSYQTLLLHSLKVIRDGKEIDQRRSARITELPQESDLEQHIYDGSYSIDVVLSDVRVGDVIEYAYTLRSEAQLYPGHFSARISVGWSVPMHRQRVRVLYPQDRPLRYRFSSGGVAPITGTAGDRQELVFEWRNTAGMQADDDRPGWVQPWPILELSDFGDWATVTRLVSPLYRLPERARPRLDEVVASLRSAGGTPQQTVMRALQFVQENIRYTSISIGLGSHTPTDPETLLERRFGDCKDKSLLLSTLLRRLDIDARPALVHSERGRTLMQVLPTPYAFDHAIARVQVGADVYWLDGTSYKQYSALEKLAPPDFAAALPIAPEVGALEAIPRPVADAGGRHVRVDIDVSKGYEDTGGVDITSQYRGEDADSMRDSLARKGATQRQSDYLNYYARFYPGLKPAGPMMVADDPEGNVLTTREHYAIDKPFTRNDKGNWVFRARTDEMYRYGTTLTASVRNSPLRVDYPEHTRQTITVHLPEDWKSKDEDRRIDNPAFRYRSRVSHEGSKVTLDYEYTALADHVDAGALAQYAADRDRLNADTDYRFSKIPDAAFRADAVRNDAPLAIAPTPLAVALGALCLGVWLMLRFVHPYDPAPRVAPAGSPTGIGGWLLLPALCALAAPIALMYRVSPLLRFADASLWYTLPEMVDGAYRDSAKPAALVLLVLAGIVLPLTVTLAVTLSRKRSSAPLIFVVTMWALQIFSALVMGAFDVSGVDTPSIDASTPAADFAIETLRNTLLALIWSAYMLKSTRVRATFVQRLPEPQSRYVPPRGWQLARIPETPAADYSSSGIGLSTATAVTAFLGEPSMSRSE